MEENKLNKAIADFTKGEIDRGFLQWGNIDKDKTKDIDLDPFKNTLQIIKLAKALILYAKCKHRGKIAFAEKIAAKYGIDENGLASVNKNAGELLNKAIEEIDNIEKE